MGLKKEVSIGAGMLTFTTECLFPCSCKDCSDLVDVNLLDEKHKCPNCNI